MGNMLSQCTKDELLYYAKLLKDGKLPDSINAHKLFVEIANKFFVSDKNIMEIAANIDIPEID